MTFGNVQVPLVPGAIVFDLTNGGNKDWGLYIPYREMGNAASLAAKPDAFELGSVGAGTGATTSTLKGGIGSASTVTPNGYIVAALAVVNAVGTANIGDGPHFWAAPFEQGREFAGLGIPTHFSADDHALRIKRAAPAQETATSITVIATDAIPSKAQTKRLRRHCPTHPPAQAGNPASADATSLIIANAVCPAFPGRFDKVVSMPPDPCLPNNQIASDNAFLPGPSDTGCQGICFQATVRRRII